MKKLIWVIFVLLLSIPLIVAIFVVVLKSASKILGKLTRKVEEMEFHPPVRSKKSYRINMIIFKVVVGINIFSCLLEVFLSLIRIIADAYPQWTPPVIIVILLVILTFLFPMMITYKIMRYIHKYFDIKIIIEEPIGTGIFICFYLVLVIPMTIIAYSQRTHPFNFMILSLLELLIFLFTLLITPKIMRYVNKHFELSGIDSKSDPRNME